MTAVRGGLFGGGIFALFVFSMLTAEYPDGDPDKARQAAQVWADLGADVVEWGEDGDAIARAVILNNSGKSIQAFEEFWKTHFAPSSGPGPAARLAANNRQVSEACETYAELITKAQYTNRTQTQTNNASLLYISTFPWQAGTA